MPERAATRRGRRPAAHSPRPTAARLPRFPLRAAAALFIERQHLDRPRSRRLTPASLARFAEDVGGIQLDSINVVDRAHHLTVWSRFGPYDRGALDRLAYQRRALHEYWAHAACLVPDSHLRWWRRAMLDYQTRHTGWAKWLRRNSKVMRAVEDAIRERGPLGNSDFKHARPPGTSGWWSWKPATYAFHFLWMTGRILVHSRSHFQKRFDLAERIAPGLEAGEPPSAQEFMRWHLTRSLHAMGAATESDMRMYLTFPRGPNAERRTALKRMIASGEVVEVEIEGAGGRWLALAADLPALEKVARRRAAASGTTLLAPFDSLLWYRERARRLFGFDYRIEVYTPGHKRVHGYYSLPIFHDGQLIGRLDAKNHRGDRRLEVRHAHFEDWFATGAPPPAASWGAVDRDRALAGIAEALWSLARFLDAESVDVARATPARFKQPLARALRGGAATKPEARAVETSA
jgi:uncharacterized protein YcaQ